MTVTDLLNRLERLRKTGEGWSALCPAHADKNPSLSVGMGDGGQILLRCSAGCPTEAVVEALGLTMSDLFPDKEEPRTAGVQRAVEIAPVAEWLHRRGLPDTEIARLHACVTPQGPAVVFRYLSAEGQLLYEKVRPIELKRFWRRPRGTASSLYGLPDLATGDDSRVVLVEGELDAHALWAVGIHAVVSVPDGCGFHLDSDTLGVLARFKEVIIAVDADRPGDNFAGKLARAFGPERCRRARFVLEDGKDANDALRSGWTRQQFEDLFANAPSCEGLVQTSRDTEGPASPDEHQASGSGTELSRRYHVFDGRICYVRTDRNGNEMTETLANFAAQVDEEITYDDGAETRREFRISGSLDDGQVLTTARVPAADFAGLTWVTREWGIRAVVSAGQGTKDHLRTAIQHLSTPSRRRIFRHTGWVELDGRPAFLYQGGAIGAEDVEVDLQPPLDRFRLPDRVDDLPEAIGWSLRLLDCGPIEVTAPLLAAVYLSPVATILNPDVTVWLHGSSGSMKSTLSALAQQHFGDFDRKTLSATWTSTDNSLEHRLFVLKDVLSVIDDYAPQADPRAQRDLDRRVQRILRNVGNRASRGRLTSELVQRPDRPPRGFLLCNGELLPPGLSINARLVPVEVERKDLDLSVITALQDSGARLSHAMRGYIEWLLPQLEDLKIQLPRFREELRREMQRGAAHLRQPEATANLYLGVDLFLQFAESARAIATDAADDLRNRAHAAFRNLAARQAQSLADIQPAEMFVETLSTLLTQGRVRLLDTFDSVPPSDSEMIGWRKGDLALVLPDAAYRRVAMFVREQGDHWAPPIRGLHKELVERGYLLPTADGRDAGQWRIGPERKKKRGWLVRLAVLGVGPGSAGAPPGLQMNGAGEAGRVSHNQLRFQDNEEDLEPLPPMPPILEQEEVPWHHGWPQEH